MTDTHPKPVLPPNVTMLPYAPRTLPVNWAAKCACFLMQFQIIPGIGFFALPLALMGVRAAQTYGIALESQAKDAVRAAKINIAWTLPMGIPILLYGWMEHQRSAEILRCRDNLVHIASATGTYSSLHDALPPSLEAIADIMYHYVSGHRDVSHRIPEVLRCPALPALSAPPGRSKVNPAQTSNYILIPHHGQTLRTILDSQHTVLLYEPLTNHHNQGICVLFCDFHSQFIYSPRAAKVIAELEAGLNPPPSLTKQVNKPLARRSRSNGYR